MTEEHKSIIMLDKATRMLAEVKTIDDAKELISLAEAARIYAKQIDLGLEAQNHAAEIKLRAQRKAGEILDEMEKNKGTRGQLIGPSQAKAPIDDTPTYAEIGITYKDAHRWQTIAAMPEDKFNEFIGETKDKEKELTTAGIYREARLFKAQDISLPTFLPDNKYQIIYADPPWKYDFSLSDSRKIENQYPTMELEDICTLPVDTISFDNCVLFLWATNPKLIEALKVIESWGFEYKTNMVWIKDKIGMGYYARQQHELLLISTKGNLPVPEPENRPSSIIEGIRKEHSKKPDIVYEIIEKMYPDHKKIELFSRNERKGWEMW